MTIICPHCKAEDGFYVKERVVGKTQVFYTAKGEYREENGGIYDGLQHYGGKFAYCTNCHKNIGKSDSLKSGEMEETQYFK